MYNIVKLGDFDVTTDFELTEFPEKALIVNTINAYSWTMTDRFPDFKKALQTSDVLLPDGVGVVYAARLLAGKQIKKIAGADLHLLLLELLNKKNGRCFYLGASLATLDLIKKRLKREYPNISVETYSPPFKKHFTDQDNQEMYDAINKFSPDVVFVGMTAPKQETWIYHNHNNINTKVICGIGAVFDFYAETKKRPSQWMINCGLEWLGRLITDPRRLWKRYLVYNGVFMYKIAVLYVKSHFCK